MHFGANIKYVSEVAICFEWRNCPAQLHCHRSAARTSQLRMTKGSTKDPGLNFIPPIQLDSNGSTLLKFFFDKIYLRVVSKIYLA